MSGTWEPVAAISVTQDMLQRYLALDLADFEQVLTAEEVQTGARLMKLQEPAWAIASELSDAELETLIRFFTLAEMQLPGWTAGKTSPVIYLVRMLKSRGGFSSDLKRWIKSNTDNRYLPNGAVML